MSLIVEDGTGLADAESYISVTDASTYHANRGNAAWAALASDTIREQLLRKATDYMVQAYRLRWKGDRVSATQAIDWPRNWVEYADYQFYTQNGAQMIGGYLYYPANEVPEEVKRACAELALLANSSDLMGEQGQGVKREKIGPIETEYDTYSRQGRHFPAVKSLLDPFLKPVRAQAIRV